eukprot:4067568-Pyramimonas_sp.AAC.1
MGAHRNVNIESNHSNCSGGTLDALFWYRRNAPRLLVHCRPVRRTARRRDGANLEPQQRAPLACWRPGAP